MNVNQVYRLDINEYIYAEILYDGNKLSIISTNCPRVYNS